MEIVQSIMKNNPCYKAGKKIAVKGLMLHSILRRSQDIVNAPYMREIGKRGAFIVFPPVMISCCNALHYSILRIVGQYCLAK